MTAPTKPSDIVLILGLRSSGWDISSATEWIKSRLSLSHDFEISEFDVERLKKEYQWKKEILDHLTSFRMPSWYGTETSGVANYWLEDAVKQIEDYLLVVASWTKRIQPDLARVLKEIAEEIQSVSGSAAFIKFDVWHDFDLVNLTWNILIMSEASEDWAIEEAEAVKRAAEIIVERERAPLKIGVMPLEHS